MTTSDHIKESSWQARTLSGVTQLKIGDICLFVWTYVCCGDWVRVAYAWSVLTGEGVWEFSPDLQVAATRSYLWKLSSKVKLDY